MSEVNADGVLLNPHEALLQEVQALTNSLTAEEPEGMEDDKAHTVYAGNGEPAGAVGGEDGGRRKGPPRRRNGKACCPNTVFPAALFLVEKGEFAACG